MLEKCSVTARVQGAFEVEFEVRPVSLPGLDSLSAHFHNPRC